MSANAQVTILVASINVPSIIELCTKSVIAHARSPFRLVVLDSSPRYRPIPYLRAQAARGRMTLIEEPTRRWQHDEALDRMLAEVKTEYFVTLDSDVEILRPGWMELMLGAMKERGAAIGYANDWPIAPDSTPQIVALVPGGRKFTVWMAMYRSDAVLGTKHPFRVVETARGTDDRGRRVFDYSDTGVELYRKLRAEGRAISIPQLDAGRYYRHYGSASNAEYARKQDLRFRWTRRKGVGTIWLRNRAYPLIRAVAALRERSRLHVL